VIFGGGGGGCLEEVVVGRCDVGPAGELMWMEFGGRSGWTRIDAMGLGRCHFTSAIAVDCRGPSLLFREVRGEMSRRETRAATGKTPRQGTTRKRRAGNSMAFCF
jgi:hypothetical protein